MRALCYIVSCLVRLYWFYKKPVILSAITKVMCIVAILLVISCNVFIGDEINSHSGFTWIILVLTAAYCEYKVLWCIISKTHDFCLQYFIDHRKTLAAKASKVNQLLQFVRTELGLPMNASLNDIYDKLKTLDEHELDRIDTLLKNKFGR